MAQFLFAANDSRSAWLAEAVRALGHEVIGISFDDVDRWTKLRAAPLSFSVPRMEWWQNYQTHPLVQRRRASVFAANAQEHADAIDGIISWGSWFPPLLYRSSGTAVPYVYYVDQSRSVLPDPLEQHAVFPRPRGGNRMQRAGYLAAKRVFGMSQWTVQQTNRAHANLPPSLVQWAGWGPCAFDLSAEPIDVCERHPMVLHVGNDFYRKGVDWLVPVAERVRAKIPGVQFVVVGRDQSGFHVDLSSIDYRGPVSDRAVLKELFRRASVFFLPNRFERAGHVLIEALSAGTPIVVSQQGGPAELVESSRAGLGVPVGDVDGYADALVKLLENPARRHAMGMEGKRLASSAYSWREVAQRVIDPLLR